DPLVRAAAVHHGQRPSHGDQGDQRRAGARRRSRSVHGSVPALEDGGGPQERPAGAGGRQEITSALQTVEARMAAGIAAEQKTIARSGSLPWLKPAVLAGSMIPLLVILIRCARRQLTD